MYRFEHDTALQRIPVTLLAGDRGTGKTTIANRIAAAWADGAAIITNERGAIAPVADHVVPVSGELVPHAVGCLCCVARSGLVDALRRLYAGQSPDGAPLRRVIVETAAGADPAPVMQTLLNNALVTQYFRLDGLVTVIDGRHWDGDRAPSRRELEQVAMADRIVVTYAQALPAASAHALSKRLRTLAPLAEVHMSAANDVEPAALTGCGLADRLASGGAADDWVGARLVGDRTDALEGGFHAFSVSIEGVVDWEALHGWLNAGIRINGDVMHRLRAVLRVAGEPAPVAVESVRHVMCPPVRIDRAVQWPDRSVLHFVTSDLDRQAVASSLRDDLPLLAQTAEQRRLRQHRALADPSLPA